jgi:light-regulated signal transduction histidine kinase (bacteriophytochrome)
MLVRDLLAYVQASGFEDDAPAEAAAAQQLEIALGNLGEAIATSGALIQHDSLPAVKVKPFHLQQLFLHLIGNAIKYRAAESAPRVHVSATAENGFWRFAVADNGMGIEPQFQEQIFGIFKRLHVNDKFSGTGIGLAICQKIVEQYGGRIQVKSEFGKGSTFFFTLPGFFTLPA